AAGLPLRLRAVLRARAPVLPLRARGGIVAAVPPRQPLELVPDTGLEPHPAVAPRAARLAGFPPLLQRHASAAVHARGDQVLPADPERFTLSSAERQPDRPARRIAPPLRDFEHGA